jgi:hypothetical protein
LKGRARERRPALGDVDVEIIDARAERADRPEPTAGRLDKGGGRSAAVLNRAVDSPPNACHSTTLPGDFHGAPADPIIVATERVEDAVPITKGGSILAYEHVETLW